MLQKLKGSSEAHHAWHLTHTKKQQQSILDLLTFLNHRFHQEPFLTFSYISGNNLQKVKKGPSDTVWAGPHVLEQQIQL